MTDELAAFAARIFGRPDEPATPDDQPPGLVPAEGDNPHPGLDPDANLRAFVAALFHHR
jgi:hypothetical protein